MSRWLSLRTMDCGELGAARRWRRARPAPVASSPTPRERSPRPPRGSPTRGVPPIGPRPLSIHLLHARPPLPADGTEVPRAAPLPWRTFASTNAVCARRSSLRLLIDWIQNQRHGAGERVPFRLRGRELSTPERREAIEPGPLTFVRQFPRGSYPTLCLETMERRIQRSCLDLKQVFGGALNVLGDRLAVSGPGKQRAEDEQVERALQQLNTGRCIVAHCVDTLRCFV